MASTPPSAAPAADAPGVSPAGATLDHWVYGVTPGHGYDIKSVSRGLNLSFYDSVIDGHYTPIRGDSLQDGKVDLVMVHPSPSHQELLYSVVGRGPDDEMGRPTFANHTAIAPLDLLTQGRLGLEDVEQGIRAFDAKNATAVGEIDPLWVPLRPPAPLESLARGIARAVTPAAAETLVTRGLVSPGGRTLLLCRNSTSDQRIRTLRMLVGALNFACGLPLSPQMSDAPTASALDHFQLIISARGVRADNTWTLLDASLEQPPLPRPGGQDALYQMLARCFQQT